MENSFLVRFAIFGKILLFAITDELLSMLTKVIFLYNFCIVSSYHC